MNELAVAHFGRIQRARCKAGSLGTTGLYPAPYSMFVFPTTLHGDTGATTAATAAILLNPVTAAEKTVNVLSARRSMRFGTLICRHSRSPI